MTVTHWVLVYLAAGTLVSAVLWDRRNVKRRQQTEAHVERLSRDGDFWALSPQALRVAYLIADFVISLIHIAAWPVYGARAVWKARRGS